MKNLLVISSSYDIPIAETVAASLSDYRVCYFDPTLTDPIAESSLENAELIAWDDAPDYPNLVSSAHRFAFQFEDELAKTLGAVLPVDSLTGWQHLTLYYFFMTYHWYARLWPAVIDQFGEDRPHVFYCDNPTNYYWPSFMPALLLLQQLRSRGIEFSAWTYGARPDESDVVINLCEGNADNEHYDLLTHLPTCFYDVGHFNDELVAAGKNVIDIMPKYWGVDVTAERHVNLMRLKDQQTLSGGVPALEPLASGLDAALDALLTPFIASAEPRMRQVRQMSNMYQAQLVSLHVLETYFANNKPGKMLMSDHESGYHGPLMAFAKRHRIPVLMVPHSKTSDNIEFPYDDVTMLNHPIQGGGLANANRRLLRSAALSYPETFAGRSTMPPRLRKIGLLLNGLSLNGVQCTDFTSYIAGIKQIDAWCKTNGVELAIRCRPGQSLNLALGEAIDAHPLMLKLALVYSMPAYAASVDLCLMYDAPTNAGIEFLRTGIPIINPVPSPLGFAEAATANTDVVPRPSVDGALAMLDGFMEDENRLHEFCRKQFANYVGLFRDARALRHYL